MSGRPNDAQIFNCSRQEEDLMMPKSLIVVAKIARCLFSCSRYGRFCFNCEENGVKRIVALHIYSRVATLFLPSFLQADIIARQK